MKNLYKYLPPFLADTFGFQQIVDITDGMGIIDDCSAYKGRAGRTDVSEPFNGSRMVSTWIRSEDVIGGTKEKLLDAFRQQRERFDPQFVLLSTAPVSSMIGTDMDDVAAEISRESGLPAAAVDLSGHKYYDQGLSKTLLALAKIMVEPAEERTPRSMNIIGGNAIDLSAENVRAMREWAAENGFRVVSQWGGQEKASAMRRAARAEINLVTAVSGLATAKWMQREFGTPYITASPLGGCWSAAIADAIKKRTRPTPTESAGDSGVLIIGEQITANAIRATLDMEYGIHGARVGSFFALDKTLASPCDTHINGEKGLMQLLESGSFSTVIGDASLRLLAPRRCHWIDLPHGAVCYEYEGEGVPQLVGGDLNRWLDAVL